MGDCCCKPKAPAAGAAVAAVATGAAGAEGAAAGAHKAAEPALVDRLIIDMLTVAASRVDSDDESPVSLVRLHAIADEEEGWMQMVTSMVSVIPLEDPFGPTAISILLDECPLPSKETVIEVTRRLGLSARRARGGGGGARVERNICAALGCVAEKLVGPNSVAILTADTLDYLLAYLSSEREPCVVLFALIAIQKFAHTADNKLTIERRLRERAPHPLLALEPLAASDDCAWRQVGFCARWALDNLFPAAGRRPSHEAADVSRVRALLDWRDASEYLQIACDGLEARCDSYSFESVRCTFRADDGRWYYEATVVTAGVMQIGWATRDCRFSNDEGYGVGDDAHSVAYDGCRRLLWHDARPTPAPPAAAWRAGDVLGCLVDLRAGAAVFALNGRRLPPCRAAFLAAGCGLYAAASFMAYQQCRFNFGSEPFRYPPGDGPFAAFNDHGSLTDEQKKVIPKRLYLERLRCSEVREDCCTICFDDAASCVLEPCGHGGLCSACTAQLRECPLCRADILHVKREPA